MTFGKKHSPENCSQVREVLSQYLDRRLDREDEAAVRKHLEGCQPCRQELASLQQTVAMLGKMQMSPSPRSFALTEAQVSRRADIPWWRSPLVWQLSTAVAALFLAVLLVGDYFQFIGPGMPASPGVVPTVVSTPSPAPVATAAPTQMPTPPGSRPLIQGLVPTSAAPEASAPQVTEPTVSAPAVTVSPSKKIAEPARRLSELPWETAIGGVVAVLAVGAIFVTRRARMMVGKRRA